MPNLNPLRYFKTSPEIIRLAVMLYIRFPLSLRNVEDLLHERGIEISHETVRYWWNRFGPRVAAEIRSRRVERMRSSPQWRWHLDEMFVKINGEVHYLWRAVDHEGEVLESFVTRPQSCAEVPEESDAPAWIARGNRDRSSAVIRRGFARDRCHGPSANRALYQQPCEEFAPTTATTGAGDASFPAYADLRRRPLLRS
jgi:hypothetical protein